MEAGLAEENVASVFELLERLDHQLQDLVVVQVHEQPVAEDHVEASRRRSIRVAMSQSL